MKFTDLHQLVHVQTLLISLHIVYD